jgi:hypothetical protein
MCQLNTPQTASAVQTLTLALTLYPEIQRKVQAEIDQIVGNSRLPDFSDEAALPYVQAVLKEVLRWHPVAPLGRFLCVAGITSLVTCDSGAFTGVPHRVTESDTYEGYHIPAGSTTIPNAWCVYHDIPALYTSAQPQRSLWQ